MSHLRRDLDFVIKQYTHFCKKLVYKKPSSSLFKILIRFIIHFNPHMHEIFLQRYCMKWVPGDPLTEMIN